MPVPDILDLVDHAWARAVALLLVAVLVGWGLGGLTLGALRRASGRTDGAWDDQLVARLGGPIRLALATAACGAGLGILGLTERAAATAADVVRAAGVAAAVWAGVRASDLVAARFGVAALAAGKPELAAVTPLAGRAAKVCLVVLGGVSVAAALGYPVASLVAGLGLGGLALALAAQKTAENVFGSVSIGVDQPFRVGDFVRIDDVVGTVESLGLRSTRVRTLDRTLVTLPNGSLADTRIENFAARDRIRLACVLGVEYGTTARQMRSILAGVEEVLRAHPKVWSDAVVVRFRELAASSLDVEVMAWFATPDWGEFQLIRQEVLLQFMAVVEAAGASFAFPTRTLHVRATP